MTEQTFGLAELFWLGPDGRIFFYCRGRPQRTSAIFRGGGGTQLQTFADMRGGGVSGMQTSAFLEKVLEGLRNQKNLISQNAKMKV